MYTTALSLVASRAAAREYVLERRQGVRPISASARRAFMATDGGVTAMVDGMRERGLVYAGMSHVVEALHVSADGSLVTAKSFRDAARALPVDEYDAATYRNFVRQ